MKLSVAALLGLSIVFMSSAGRAQQQAMENVEIKTYPVAKNIYMLEGQGGNIGVSVGEDGILIIDDQFAPLAEKIRAALKKLDNGKLKFLLNTHVHGDHTGGNAKFGTEATIIAHENTRKRLLKGPTTMPKEGLPIITFDDSLSVHFNGEDIRAKYYPAGHTDTDIVIFFPGANVVHMGDLMVNGKFPFIDLVNGGSFEGYLKNVTEIMNSLPADVKIIPGHGPLANMDDLRKFHEMLVGTSDYVKQQAAAGKTKEQIMEGGLPEKWKSWDGGFVGTGRWIAAIMQSVNKK